MSPAAQTFLTVVGVLVWIALALLLAIAIGRTIREANRREVRPRPGPKPCCPHPAAEAPETVRGHFRAIVIPAQPDPRGQHVDVRA